MDYDKELEYCSKKYWIKLNNWLLIVGGILTGFFLFISVYTSILACTYFGLTFLLNRIFISRMVDVKAAINDRKKDMMIMVCQPNSRLGGTIPLQIGILLVITVLFYSEGTKTLVGGIPSLIARLAEGYIVVIILDIFVLANFLSFVYYRWFLFEKEIVIITVSGKVHTYSLNRLNKISGYRNYNNINLLLHFGEDIERVSGICDDESLEKALKRLERSRKISWN